MKRLFLLRHAKSAWDDPVARDFDRPLNAKGHRAGRAMGQQMHRLGLAFDVVIASPAARVVETLEELSQGYGANLGARFDERLYLASFEAMLDLIRATEDKVASLLLAGHSPGLEQLALHLAREEDTELRALIEEKFPTGALVELSLPVDHWQDVEEGTALLARFIRPRDLDPELGPGY